MIKQGILLINLGTPDNCEPAAVKRYLKAFLNDPRVVDLPVYLRYPFVNFFIIPLRYKKSARAYQKIWGAEGSPLLRNSLALKERLQAVLGENYQVELAMRYGQPAIKEVLKEFKDCTSLKVIPLFPQYSSAATGSAIENCLTDLASQWNLPALSVQRDFYNHPGFIQAYADRIRDQLGGNEIEMLLFSYHGLPERQINKSCKASCDRVHACPPINSDNIYCYRAQCYATTALIAQALHLTPEQYHVSFQSRLGRTPWIKPYTDLLLPKLAKKGVKKLAVVCPSFVADCLETLEEINIRARAQWLKLGGSHFTFIPCLNHSKIWVDALVDMVG